MQKQTYTIINKRGLHARAAAKLATLAAQFKSRIHVSTTGNWVDAKSVMSLMLLAATQGTNIDVQTEGDDEMDALTAVKNLIENRFEEEE